MNYVKLCSNVFLLLGTILLIALLGFFIVDCGVITLNTNSWYVLHRTEVIGIKNILLIMSPFSLFTGYTMKKIYNEIAILYSKIDRLTSNK
ncbi:hypothetical protein [Clostridium sp. UBA3887]|uniref:hypothetical protein n=1 Tax=Clostridium sp. UBA3887 TaxID=1946356 RepID=UPI0032179A4E